jgi:hypothetical protein
MNIIILESQFKRVFNLNEGVKFSESPPEERYKTVAEKVIQFMDLRNLKSIPRYRFLQNMETMSDLGFNMKTFLSKNLKQGEYDGYVKPLIKKLRPEITYSTELVIGANNYLLDDGVAVKSLGEVMVYNTFKMNDIILKYEDPKRAFHYLKQTYKGEKLVKKKPDFYWEESDIHIEVAGLKDQKTFGVDYLDKLERAKAEVEKMGSDMIILDYFTYKDNPKGFYKYVCETFNFPYNPDNFWLSIGYVGMDKEKYLEQVKNIISKGGKKTRGEQDMLKKIVTRYLTKSFNSPDTDNKLIGYENVKDFKRDTGIGLKFGDKELRKMAQISWCKSSGSNMKTYEKFKELFGHEHTLSKNTIETMKFKFPEEFDMNKRDEICGNI